MPDATQPPKESLLDRLMSVGVWVGAILAAAVVLWFFVIIVRLLLGDAP